MASNGEDHPSAPADDNAAKYFALLSSRLGMPRRDIPGDSPYRSGDPPIESPGQSDTTFNSSWVHPAFANGHQSHYHQEPPRHYPTNDVTLPSSTHSPPAHELPPTAPFFTSQQDPNFVNQLRMKVNAEQQELEKQARASKALPPEHSMPLPERLPEDSYASGSSMDTINSDMSSIQLGASEHGSINNSVADVLPEHRYGSFSPSMFPPHHMLANQPPQPAGKSPSPPHQYDLPSPPKSMSPQVSLPPNSSSQSAEWSHDSANSLRSGQSENADSRTEVNGESYGAYDEGTCFDLRASSNVQLNGREWSAQRLKLPSAESNRCYLQSNPDEPVSKWSYIKSCLKLVATTRDLEQAIKSYNPTYASTPAFRGEFVMLHALAKFPNFETKTLPYIIHMALQLPTLVPKSPPLLLPQRMAVVTLDQKQCVSLIANMFLCTFPRRRPREWRDKLRTAEEEMNEYSDLPDVHFVSLFSYAEDSVFAKLQCICSYFEYHRLNDSVCGAVHFRRVALEPTQVPNLPQLVGPILEPVVLSTEKIEEVDDTWQADFANKVVGGGVLGHGCVQEEIRFCISPELFVARLLCPELAPNESMLITGSMRYSRYTGYARTFRYAGPFDDVYGKDHPTDVVVFDAIGYNSPEDARRQFTVEDTKRELVKVAAAFSYVSGSPKKDITTGRWGCGAFNGNVAWKFLIQLVVASAVGRRMRFCTVGDTALTSHLEAFTNVLRLTEPTIKEMYSLMRHFDASKLPSMKRAFHGVHVELHRRSPAVDSNGFEILDYIAAKLKRRFFNIADSTTQSRPHASSRPSPGIQQPSSSHGRHYHTSQPYSSHGNAHPSGYYGADQRGDSTTRANYLPRGL